MITLKNLVKTYNPKSQAAVTALDGVNLNVENGEMLAVMGVSGSGKSTLLNILGCIDSPTGGEYLLDGTDISRMKTRMLYRVRNEKIGFILQDYGLIEDKTVLENVMYPLAFSRKVSFLRMKPMAKAALETVGILNLRRKKIGRISGGQKQRVAIARAIVNKPELILADEPTAALDRKTADEIMGVLKALNEQGTTVIIVTHDKRIADLCGRTVYIRDGVIRETEDTQ
ncbi:MAG: ABC transporter ATP-binding protein [Oscillospiraceae bacterium]